MSNKVIFTFNKFFYDLVKDLKDISPELKTIIKQHYKVKNSSTHEHFNAIKESIDKEEVFQKILLVKVEELFEIDGIQSIELLKDVTIEKILQNVSEDYRPILTSFVLIFTLLIVLSKHCESIEPSSEESTESTESKENIEITDGDVLFDKTMAIIIAMQNNKPFDELLDDIFVDDIKTILIDLDKVIVKKAPESTHSADTPEGLAGIIANTKIGEIAREISKDIDIASLNIEKPEDLLNFQNNNVLGNIVSKVGATLQSKFESGELKHDELLKEAMGMLGNLSGSSAGGILDNPLFKELIKSQLGGQKGAKAKVNTSKLDAMASRERLRKKLEKRKAEKDKKK
jgi:hypothetical protein